MAEDFQTKYSISENEYSVIAAGKSAKNATTGIFPNTLIMIFYFASIMPALSNSGQSLILIVLVNVFFIGALSAFFAYNLLTAFWCYYGRETFRIDSSNCFLSKTIFHIGMKKTLPLSQITSISLSYTDADTENGTEKPKNLLQSIGLGRGKISVKTSDKEYFFGAALSDQEISDILAAAAKFTGGK